MNLHDILAQKQKTKKQAPNGVLPSNLEENVTDLQIGDPVIISGKGINFEGATGDVVELGKDGRFVVVDLYNHSKHSFHSSDVSYNDYAGSDDEEARMYDAGEFRDDMDESVASRKTNPLLNRPWEPATKRLVKDRKTGKMYDPEEQFAKTMNSPEVKAQMKRMAAKEGVAEGVDSELEQLTGNYRALMLSDMLDAEGKRKVTMVYNLLRDPIMQGDKEEYEKMHGYVGGKYPDIFDLLVGADDYVKSVDESSPETSLNLLKGLKTWQVVIMNNYYRGKYSDYSGRYYYVLASSPEEARQVVLDNADAILQELLAMKSHNGKKILPRGTAVRITPERINGIKDGTEAGRMSTAGFKKMFGPQGPMMVKLANGAIVDVQGQEQGVAEGDPGYDKHSFIGKIRRSREADNKGWGQLGQQFAANSEEEYRKALRKGNRYYNMTRGDNKTPGGFPKTTVEQQGVAEGTGSGYTYKDTDEGTYLTNDWDETLFIPDVRLRDQGFKQGDRRLPEVWQMNLEMADETGAYIVGEEGVAEEQVDEVSRGDYHKKATMAKAMAQMSAGFARSPEEREKFTQIAGRRERGLERSKARTDKFWADKAAKDEADRLEQLRAKYAGVDIDAEIARLKPAIQSAYNEFQYGARNTYGQGRDDYNRLMAQVQELERAKQALSGLDEHIGKVKDGYRLYSHTGKNLGTYPSHAGAEKREKQVNYFKHATEDTEELSELSNQLLGDYKKAAGISARDLDKAGKYDKANKRFKGIVRATNKEFDNDLKKYQKDEDVMQTAGTDSTSPIHENVEYMLASMKRAGYDIK